MKMQQGAERFGAKTEYAEVIDLDLEGDIKKVLTQSEEILGRTVVIATGANPKELGIKNEAEFVGKGIHYCAHCDGRFYKDKTVMVVGGGNSAVSDALYLANLAKKVYLVHRRDTLRATKIYNAPLKEASNIEFIWNSQVKEFLAEKRIKGVILENIKTSKLTEIPLDGIFISIGRKPATDFLKGKIELDELGYIIADETTKTNIKGVYAVGDVRTKALRQVVTAVADGATAVHFAEEFLVPNRSVDEA